MVYECTTLDPFNPPISINSYPFTLLSVLNSQLSVDVSDWR